MQSAWTTKYAMILVTEHAAKKEAAQIKAVDACF